MAIRIDYGQPSTLATFAAWRRRAVIFEAYYDLELEPKFIVEVGLDNRKGSLTEPTLKLTKVPGSAGSA